MPAKGKYTRKANDKPSIIGATLNDLQWQGMTYQYNRSNN